MDRWSWIFVAAMAGLCPACICGGETDDPQRPDSALGEHAGSASEDMLSMTRCGRACVAARILGRDEYDHQCEEDDDWPAIAVYDNTAITCGEAMDAATGEVDRCIDQCDR